MTRPVRVRFLTHYFTPEVGAPQTRIAALAGELAARGFEVTVHTGFPHYPDGRVPAPYRNRPLLREQRGGIPVVRSAVLPVANAGFTPRLADHVVFAGSSTLASRASAPTDVVVAETPPLFLAAAAPLHARLAGARLVLNVADLWPDSAVELGALRRPRLIAAARALERAAYRGAVAITVPARGMARRLDERTGGRVHWMPPAVDLERFATLPDPRSDGPLRVLYAGTIGMAHGLGTLVDAARLAGPEVVRVTIAGSGAERAEVGRRARATGAPVDVIGSVPAERIPALYGQADAGAVLLRDLPLFAEALPTKLLECLAAGRPVVLAASGEAAELVRDGGCGVVVAPEDPHALADAFRALHGDRARLAALGRAGRRLAAERYGRQPMVDRWAELLGRVADAPRSAR